MENITVNNFKAHICEGNTNRYEVTDYKDSIGIYDFKARKEFIYPKEFNRILIETLQKINT